MTARLLYFADPMCSWCYGFAPQILQEKSNYPEIDFQLVMGGLRPFGRETMPEIGGFLRHTFSNHPVYSKPGVRTKDSRMVSRSSGSAQHLWG